MALTEVGHIEHRAALGFEHAGLIEHNALRPEDRRAADPIVLGRLLDEVVLVAAFHVD